MESTASASASTEAEARGTQKAAFELVLANDEGVEVLEPRDRKNSHEAERVAAQ